MQTLAMYLDSVFTTYPFVS